MLIVIVHAANIHDSTGARRVLEGLFKRVPTIKLLWADQAYRGPLVEWIKTTFSCEFEIVYRRTHAFEVLPRRWVVERTFAGLSRYRRLVRDYEKRPTSSTAMVYIASIRILLKKLFPQQPNKKCFI